MTSKQRERIFKKAKAVLQKNWHDIGGGQGYTRPAAKIYPFQWNWDSAFIAYAYSHYNLPRAIKELRTLFKGQWSNGFLPHIFFHKRNKNYFPNSDFWASKDTTDQAPKKLLTSGISQPPLQAMTVWHIYKALKKSGQKKRAELFLKNFYPKLYNLHKYFYTHRDPEGWGLITIYHPWESGLDNSPRWDETLKKIKARGIPKYKRIDTKFVDPKYRPTKTNYDKYLYLAMHLKKKHYNDEMIYKDHPFKIKDKVFSSILYNSNKRLKKIAETLGEDSSEIDGWMKKFEKNITGRLWDKKDKLFYDYDLNSKKLIRVKTTGALIPLITGTLSKKRTQLMIKYLDKANFCGEESCAISLVPSTGIKEKYFNPQSYWRGPIWINMNWFLWKWFVEAGMGDRAKDMRLHMLNLVADKGFWEFYSPLDGKGIGTKDFSWTAALAVDLLYE